MPVVHDRLNGGSATLGRVEHAHFVRLLLVVLEDDREGKKDEGHDDRESTVSPAPSTGVVDEVLSGQRTGEGGTDEGGVGKGEGEGSVPQTGSVGQEDLQNEVDTVVADPVDHIAGRV